MRKLYVLAILATLLATACALPTTGSIGVQNSVAINWIIYVDTLVAGTVAANTSTVIDNVKPGAHEVKGSSGPYIVPPQWVTVEVGQTAWVNW